MTTDPQQTSPKRHQLMTTGPRITATTGPSVEATRIVAAVTARELRARQHKRAMTTRYHLEFSFIVSGYGSPKDLEVHLDCVADSLAEMHGVVDPDLGANLAEGIVTFTMSVDAKHACTGECLLAKVATVADVLKGV